MHSLNVDSFISPEECLLHDFPVSSSAKSDFKKIEINSEGKGDFLTTNGDLTPVRSNLISENDRDDHDRDDRVVPTNRDAAIQNKNYKERSSKSRSRSRSRYRDDDHDRRHSRSKDHSDRHRVASSDYYGKRHSRHGDHRHNNREESNSRDHDKSRLHRDRKRSRS